MFKILELLKNAMIDEIATAGFQISDPEQPMYQDQLAQCVKQVSYIRYQMQMKFGGSKTYSLQKANIKFFDYI